MTSQNTELINRALTSLSEDEMLFRDSVYEFADRNIPIFVFACTWERNAEQTTSEEEELHGDPSTGRGIRQAIHQFVRGERGITDEVRVFKLGVWGPRTIGEAEASFQQQLNLLVQPMGAGAKT